MVPFIFEFQILNNFLLIYSKSKQLVGTLNTNIFRIYNYVMAIISALFLLCGLIIMRPPPGVQPSF